MKISELIKKYQAEIKRLKEPYGYRFPHYGRDFRDRGRVEAYQEVVADLEKMEEKDETGS